MINLVAVGRLLVTYYKMVKLVKKGMFGKKTPPHHDLSGYVIFVIFLSIVYVCVCACEGGSESLGMNE